MKARTLALLVAGVTLLAGAPAARSVTLATIESDLALSSSERAQLEKGEVVTRTVSNSTERELAVGLAVRIQSPAADLAKQLLDGLALRENPDVLARSAISTGAIQEFAGVKLQDAAAAKAYLAAKPGPALNLSSAEIAAFQALAKQPAASSDPKSAVESLIRQQLQARYRSYLAKGLAGIAPYARSSGDVSPSADFLAATRASKLFAKYAPHMVQVMTDYPKTRPADLQERQQWTEYNAQGARALVLSQFLALPDGAGFSIAARQYYVSTSYNGEQNMALLVPADEGGTVVVLASRVATEQVAGFGGSVKRGIGAKLMADTLAGVAERVGKASGKN